MSDKMQEEFKSCSLHDDYVEVKSLEENRKWFSAGWHAAQSVPVVGEPVSDVVREYTTGRWHHGNGFLCMGTLRIARADLDTNPSAEVQSAFFDEICATLNAPIPATLREKAAEADELRKDAERYRKLRGWMSSNVKEGWGRVTDLSAVFCYVSWQEGDSYLDNLPECNVGLMQKDIAQGKGE